MVQFSPWRPEGRAGVNGVGTQRTHHLSDKWRKSADEVEVVCNVGIPLVS